ncbi:copper ABC transporter ATP-binding protein [Halorientalis sp. IM1011]|uniref:ABC transporter ATP-binding protein n=1 Tax=Halorientalis sp. IM1011 TaxID=1932360 RepID=UPI00097CD728|nr:ABC transporter ATP-binding protein [Halorientalis sp. IM1011]AQL41603.1 copper ABC transporter ATP-binding protein [Halorientalis sp. IM1011]
MATIETRGLTKSFGDVDAVVDLDLTVEDGEVFGFLGPNGAGKSTTINLLLDYIRPTGGTAEVFGMDAQEHPAKIRERVGVLPEGYGFDDPLTGREYLEWAIRTKDADDDPETLLDLVSLTDDAERMAKGYSKGMQQRLAFAMSLIDDPDLLILDEPSTGLDPNGIRTMREVVADVAADGTTVFFSSHHLAEVEAVSDRVGVMNEGELVAVDSIDGLRDSVGGHATLELQCAAPPTDLGVEALDGVVDVAVDGHTLSVTCADPARKVDVITHVAERADVVDVLSSTVSLETLFNELTEGGRENEAAAEVVQ